MEQGQVYTVTQVNEYIKSLLESAPHLSSIQLKGEISNFTHHKSGHLYFSLKDEGGLIRAVMFRGSASALKFLPENGMKVVARGSVSAYVRDGSYQLYVSSMEPDGIGALYLAYEQLKRKLEAEGLFDRARKRPIPKCPTRVGVITSPTGAAVRDIIHVTGRRFPLAKIILYPALVQGEGAPASLIRGMQYFNRSRSCDVIIIGRGGGSIEDLWGFNDEGLARVIASSEIPVISAVGHETDFTICDFVADLRAPTPSAAAEMAVPDAVEFRRKVNNVTDRMALLLRRNLERNRKHLELLSSRPVLSDGEWILRDRRLLLDGAFERMERRMERLLMERKSGLAEFAGKLEALSPLAILSRGYGVVADEKGTLVRSVGDVKVGDGIRLRLSDGTLETTVKSKKEI